MLGRRAEAPGVRPAPGGDTRRENTGCRGDVKIPVACRPTVLTPGFLDELRRLREDGYSVNGCAS
jgi:hypothetical protein